MDSGFWSTAGMLADIPPLGETGSANAGTAALASRDDHQHPRPSSVTSHTTNASGEATVVFTRAFVGKPGTSPTYEEAADNPPVVFKVKTWTTDGNGNYIGCVVKAYRGQTLPASLTVLSALVSFNVFAGVAANVPFTWIALQSTS